MKSRKCKSCKTEFTPTRSMQQVCSPECAFISVKANNDKQKRKEAIKDRLSVRKRLDAMQTLSQLKKKAQTAFNAFIRARDEGKPCISCGRYHDGQYHAGHYRSVGSAPELRFEELNVWKQCQPCNTHLSGNLINYRRALVEKIGIEAVEWLEGHHKQKKYTREQLKELASEYRAKTKVLQQQRRKNASN